MNDTSPTSPVIYQVVCGTFEGSADDQKAYQAALEHAKDALLLAPDWESVKIFMLDPHGRCAPIHVRTVRQTEGA